MFVTTLGMDNFDCTKMNAHLKKILSLSTGGAHSRVQASNTSPTSPPCVAKQLTALFHTQPLFSFLVYCHCSTNDILCILVKTQPSTRSTGPWSPTRLGIRSQDLGLPNSTVLATVAFLLLLDTSLLSQAGTTHYSQILTLQHSTKLFYFIFFKVDLSLSSNFQPPHEGFRQATS